MDLEQIRQLWPLEIAPREVQLEALQAGLGKPGFAYFMRMRLGKTWLAFAEYTILRSQGHVDWMVVICPNSIKIQWKEAIEQVDEFIPVRIYDSQQKLKTKRFFNSNKQGGVFIINYESMRSFMDEYVIDPTFNPGKTYLVADESTKIKDPSAKMTKACHELSNLCTYTRILTGKPRANSSSDLWAQLEFIRATRHNFYQFKHRYCLMGGYRGSQYLEDINTEQLKAEMAPHCYIAPDKYLKGFRKIYEPMRRVRLTKELDKMYKDMEDDLVLQISMDLKITAPIVLTKYLRLQQISSGIAGDIDGAQHNLIDPSHNPRIRVVREILDSEIDHKVIIPCRFRLSIANLDKVLSADGHKVTKLVGSMSPKDIEEQKKRFNEGDSDVMLAQLQVLSFGHTLPGPNDNPCDSMIYYENDFSLLNRMQSESRPENADRDIPISYYDMYASKMDKYLISTLIKKEDASTALMGYIRELGLRPELAKGAKNAKNSGNADREAGEAQADFPF